MALCALPCLAGYQTSFLVIKAWLYLIPCSAARLPRSLLITPGCDSFTRLVRHERKLLSKSVDPLLATETLMAEDCLFRLNKGRVSRFHGIIARSSSCREKTRRTSCAAGAEVACQAICTIKAAEPCRRERPSGQGEGEKCAGTAVRLSKRASFFGNSWQHHVYFHCSRQQHIFMWHFIPLPRWNVSATES